MKRVGLLATQAIRGGANRAVLDRVKSCGDIFWAQSDRDWVLDGAAVHVSMIGFDGGGETQRALDGKTVQAINSDLTSGVDVSKARELQENVRICFRSDEKGGPFDIDADTAQKMLTAPTNPNGRPNSDVVRPYLNARDITQRPEGKWIIDFGCDTREEDAARYEQPFEYVKHAVKPIRDASRSPIEKEYWWLHRRPAPDMRLAVAGLSRFIVTPRVAKHRLFVWLSDSTIPDCQLYVFARDDDYFFGVLHSSPHELWARGQGTQLRDVESGFRYTPTTTFETFPFPWPPGKEPKDDPRVQAIAEAARTLVEERDRWLNPPGASEAELAQRTLTNLYNQRPTWLELAHRRLDEAVLDAYGWPHDLSDEEILARLLELNKERAAAQDQTKSGRGQNRRSDCCGATGQIRLPQTPTAGRRGVALRMWLRLLGPAFRCSGIPDSTRPCEPRSPAPPSRLDGAATPHDRAPCTLAPSQPFPGRRVSSRRGTPRTRNRCPPCAPCSNRARRREAHHCRPGNRAYRQARSRERRRRLALCGTRRSQRHLPRRATSVGTRAHPPLRRAARPPRERQCSRRTSRTLRSIRRSRSSPLQVSSLPSLDRQPGAMAADRLARGPQSQLAHFCQCLRCMVIAQECTLSSCHRAWGFPGSAEEAACRNPGAGRPDYPLQCRPSLHATSERTLAALEPSSLASQVGRGTLASASPCS